LPIARRRGVQIAALRRCRKQVMGLAHDPASGELRAFFGLGLARERSGDFRTPAAEPWRES